MNLERYDLDAERGFHGPAGQRNPITASNYNAFGPTSVAFGSSDSDSFAYDPNTGRKTNYTFTVGGRSMVSNLTWNANGTLQQLAITDPFNSSNNQTCMNTYDDLARLIQNNCGSVWGQSFSYDPFGNIAKTALAGSSGTSFQATYNENPPTNRYLTLPGGSPTYDGNGNVTYDGINGYAWDSEGKMVQTPPSETITYDALGRLIEWSYTGSNGIPQIAEQVFAPTGEKLLCANGQTVTTAFPRGPGGTIAYYKGTTLDSNVHSAWLGTPRLYSFPDHSISGDIAIAPFGEDYIPPGYFTLFTGVADNILWSDLGTFPAREYENNSGRWLSPDPAGLSAVDLTNPQTLNRYAYVGGNPLALTDPTVMCAYGDPACFAVASKPACGWWNIFCGFSGNGTSPIPSPYFQASNAGVNPDQATSPSGFTNPGGSGSGGITSKPPKTGILTTIKQKFCAAIPDARTISLDVEAGGLGSVHGSVTATLDYKTGSTSFSAGGGFLGGWNGVLSASVSTGFVYGSSDTNTSTNYSVGSAISGYYSKSGSAREVGVSTGWGLLGKYSLGVGKYQSTASFGNVPGLTLPSDNLLGLLKQVCR